MVDLFYVPHSRELSSKRFLAGSLQYTCVHAHARVCVCMCVYLCVNVCEIEMWLCDIQAGRNMWVPSCVCIPEHFYEFYEIQVCLMMWARGTSTLVWARKRNTPDKIPTPYIPKPRIIRWSFMHCLPTTIGLPAACSGQQPRQDQNLLSSGGGWHACHRGLKEAQSSWGHSSVQGPDGWGGDLNRYLLSQNFSYWFPPLICFLIAPTATYCL